MTRPVGPASVPAPQRHRPTTAGLQHVLLRVAYDAWRVAFGHDLFVSYPTASHRYACDLAGKLEARGFRVFCDETGLPTGDDVERILAAARLSRMIVVVLSDAALVSTWVADEVDAHYTAPGRPRCAPIFFRDGARRELPPRLELLKTFGSIRASQAALNAGVTEDETVALIVAAFRAWGQRVVRRVVAAAVVLAMGGWWAYTRTDTYQLRTLFSEVRSRAIMTATIDDAPLGDLAVAATLLGRGSEIVAQVAQIPLADTRLRVAARTALALIDQQDLRAADQAIDVAIAAGRDANRNWGGSNELIEALGVRGRVDDLRRAFQKTATGVVAGGLLKAGWESEAFTALDRAISTSRSGDERERMLAFLTVTGDIDLARKTAAHFGSEKSTGLAMLAYWLARTERRQALQATLRELRPLQVPPLVRLRLAEAAATLAPTEAAVVVEPVPNLLQKSGSDRAAGALLPLARVFGKLGFVEAAEIAGLFEEQSSRVTLLTQLLVDHPPPDLIARAEAIIAAEPTEARLEARQLVAETLLDGGKRSEAAAILRTVVAESGRLDADSVLRVAIATGRAGMTDIAADLMRRVYGIEVARRNDDRRTAHVESAARVPVAVAKDGRLRDAVALALRLEDVDQRPSALRAVLEAARLTDVSANEVRNILDDADRLAQTGPEQQRQMLLPVVAWAHARAGNFRVARLRVEAADGTAMWANAYAWVLAEYARAKDQSRFQALHKTLELLRSIPFSSGSWND